MPKFSVKTLTLIPLNIGNVYDNLILAPKRVLVLIQVASLRSAIDKHTVVQKQN